MRLFFLIAFFCSLSASAQELYPHTEPASTIPKGVIGLRYTLEAFRSGDRLGTWHGMKIMYGASSRLSLIGNIGFSNLHTKKFPSPVSANFSDHHSPVNYSSTRARLSNPYLLEGFNLYGKFRFISRDGEHSHLRCAVYGEYSHSFVAHKESEPVLNGSTSGLGAGLIVTKLIKKFAASATLGYIHPFSYEERDSQIVFTPGNALVYNFSFGYLLFPVKYKSYKDLNVNVYVELINKLYGKAEFYHHNPVNVESYPVMVSGQYSEVRPAIQLIINSNTRLDASVYFSLFQRVDVRSYPVYMVNLQRYFF